MRLAVKRFDLSEPDRDETWAFLCECGAEDCTEWVTLPLAEYEALRKADTPILADGHVVDEFRRTRHKSHGLVDEAKALRAQAELQLKRAMRNLGKRKPS
jgi:hypothetical protein